MVCVDFTGCTNQERFWCCAPQGVDGGLRTFALGVALVDGEREENVDFVHNAIRLLVADPTSPEVEYLAATRLLISDGAVAIINSHEMQAEDDAHGSYGGMLYKPATGTWCVLVSAALLVEVVMVLIARLLLAIVGVMWQPLLMLMLRCGGGSRCKGGAGCWTSASLILSANCSLYLPAATTHSLPRAQLLASFLQWNAQA